MTQSYTTGDGFKHPISDEFLLYPPGWTEAAENEVRGRWRSGEELSADERVYLDAWTNRENLERAWKWLGVDKGHPSYTDHFGDEGTLDQVHGQAWSPDTCGCTVHHVFDHNRRHEPGNEIKPHRTHVLCDRHATLPHLAVDATAHHEHLLKECQHKEAVMAAITDAHGLEHSDRPRWYFNENHELVVDTSTHPTLHVDSVRHALRDQFAHSVIHVK